VAKENAAQRRSGDVVPDDVKLYPLPPEVAQKVPQARSHMFFVKDDEVILISSSDRRVRRCNQKEIDRLVDGKANGDWENGCTEWPVDACANVSGCHS
jgi:hypothetical protein